MEVKVLVGLTILKSTGAGDKQCVIRYDDSIET